jgi:hypothetical protein
MTQKEKAKELVDSFKFETKQSEIINDIILGDISVIFQHHKAKQCALIAVDEILKINAIKDIFVYEHYKNDYQSLYKYWQEVKQEIEKL